MGQNFGTTKAISTRRLGGHCLKALLYRRVGGNQEGKKGGRREFSLFAETCKQQGPGKGGEHRCEGGLETRGLSNKKNGGGERAGHA